MSLRIGVVGLGFAGTAAATLFRRDGHEVTVYETTLEPSAVGAGIVLQPTGMAALDELGLLGKVLDRGSRLAELHCTTPSGATIFRLRYEELGSAFFGLGMHRGALFEILLGAAEQEGASIRTGVDVRAIEEATDVAFVVDTRGERHGPHDLVVVANGAQSQLRKPHLVARRRPYPYGALWLVGRDPDHRAKPALRQVADGTRRLVGLLPSGLGPRTNGDVPLVTLFWSLRMDEVDRVRRGDFGAFKATVHRLFPDADFLLDQVSGFDALLPSGYLDVVLRRPHDGRVVYIGDAAHAMSPQLGQGCNLGLVDAVVFARALRVALSRPGTRGLDAILEAARAYGRERRHAVAFYQRASRWLTPFFQSDLGFLGPLRDLAMPWACRIPLLRRPMTTTMAGIGLGFLRPPLGLAPFARVLEAGSSERAET